MKDLCRKPVLFWKKKKEKKKWRKIRKKGKCPDWLDDLKKSQSLLCLTSEITFDFLTFSIFDLFK